MSRISSTRPHGVYPFLLLFLFLVPLAVPSEGQVAVTTQELTNCLAKDDYLAVDLGAFTQDFLAQKFLSNDLFPPDTTWEVVEYPQRGWFWELSDDDGDGENDGFVYRPSDSFWDLGLDTIVYSLVEPGGGVSVGTIYLYPSVPLKLVYEEDFEGDDYLQFLYSSGPASFGSQGEALMTGPGELEITVMAHGQAYLEIPLEKGDPGPGSDSNSDSGRTRGMIDDSGDRGHLINSRIVLIELGNDQVGPRDASVQLVYEWNGQDRQVTAEVWDESLQSFIPTAPVNLVSTTPEVELTWYRRGDVVGVLVAADGRTEGPVEGSNPLAEFGTTRIGVMPEDYVPTASFRFDNIRIWRQSNRGAYGLPPLYLSNDFEQDKYSDRTTLVGTGLTIAPEAALTGEGGLEIDLLAGNSYLVMTLDEVADELAMQFRVDTSALSMGNGELFTLVAGGDTALGLRIYLANINGVIHSATHVYKNEGQPMAFSWTPVPDQFEILFRLQVSSSNSGGNGFLQLWLDGQDYALFHVPNGSRKLSWLRLGAQGVDALTSGYLYLDDLAVWK